MTDSGKKIKILVAGIGGVGGYFGGMLASHYKDNPDVDIYFLARGEHLRQIQNCGLKVITGATHFMATPALATDNPAAIGTVDFMLVCTKSYDLEATIKQVKRCISQETIILPLLNGVNSKDRIAGLLPGNIILDGCVYLVARLKEPGVIENIGNIQSLYFGLEHVSNDKLLMLEKLLKEANIQAVLSGNISSVIWEKFIFIAAIATATSRFDFSIGALLADADKTHELALLVEEVKHLAIAKNIQVPADITSIIWHKLRAMPFATMTSMHSDFKNRKPQTELESLTGYVVREGKLLHVATPTFEKMYEALKSKMVDNPA